MSETFARETLHEFFRDDGTLYFNGSNSGAYGHRECLVRDFGEPTLPDRFRKDPPMSKYAGAKP